MQNPFTDILEWWDEEHWIKNGNYEQFFTAKYSWPAVLYKQKCALTSQGIHYDIHAIALKAMQELYPGRLLNDPSGISWSFNNHPDTTYEDIQAVLIHCAEVWRNTYA